MQEAQEGFNLFVWISKLTVRDWLLGLVMLLVLVGPGLFGKSRAKKEAPPPPLEPSPALISRKKRSPRRKRK